MAKCLCTHESVILVFEITRPNNCEASTWKVISNSLDIDFIHGRSCKKHVILLQFYIQFVVKFHMQCSALITWSIFLTILKIDTLQLASEGEIWSVFSEYQIWFEVPVILEPLQYWVEYMNHAILYCVITAPDGIFYPCSSGLLH